MTSKNFAYLLGAAILFILGMHLFHDDILRESKPIHNTKQVTTINCEIAYFTVENGEMVKVSNTHPKDAGLKIIKLHGAEDYTQVIMAPNITYPVEPGVRKKAQKYGANYAYLYNVHVDTKSYHNTSGRIQ